ncbi:MAG: hypothetical protein ACREOI_19535 [bacterium]
MKNNLSRFRRDEVHSWEVIEERCPDGGLLEYILLSAHHDRKLFEQFQEHFLVCDTCQRRIGLIELYYVILDREIQQEVSPAVVDMAQKLAEAEQA